MIAFKFAEHSVMPGRQVIEMWSNNQLVGQITASDNIGLRVTSKYNLQFFEVANDRATPVNIAEIRIGE